MKVAEDLGIAMANVLAEKERNQKELEEGVEFVTTNICKYYSNNVFSRSIYF